MKKLIIALCICALLAGSASAATEFFENFYGAWIDYGTITTYSNGSSSTLTRADNFASNGYLDDAYIFHEDGTVDIRLNGQIIDTGTWKETNDSRLFANSGYENALTVMVTDSSGNQVLCAFLDSRMYMSASWGDMKSTYIHYKPDLYTLEAEVLSEKAWKLDGIFIEDYYESSLGGKYDRVEPAKLQKDLQFILHCAEDGLCAGTADLLINYVPVYGYWQATDLNINITTENFDQINLEYQHDGSLFGTIYYEATGKTEYVEFTPVEGLDFQQNPKPVSAFEGTWNMTGLRDELLFYYPVDSLTFTQTIEISGNTATMTYIGSKDKISQKMNVSVAGGPAIDSDDTGSILILTRKDGHKMPCWLKEDGSLYMKNPGALSFCFAKE